MAGNIFISYNTNLEECQHSGDEGFDENDTPGPRKRAPIYKIGTLHLTLTKKLKGQVHGSAHTYLSKCCFSAGTYCIVCGSNMIMS